MLALAGGAHVFSSEAVAEAETEECECVVVWRSYSRSIPAASAFHRQQARVLLSRARHPLMFADTVRYSSLLSCPALWKPNSAQQPVIGQCQWDLQSEQASYNRISVHHLFHMLVTSPVTTHVFHHNWYMSELNMKN